MPVTVSYPGVYIQEIPSGSHTIVGVPTSIAAFVGRTLWGPVEEPILLSSFGDYQRFFGGLSYSYPVSYAVSDFFSNGGGQCYVVRLFEADPEAAGSPPSDGTAQLGLSSGTLSIPLEAANPGTWANTNLTALVSLPANPTSKDKFNLTLTFKQPNGPTQNEQYFNVTTLATDANGNVNSNRLDLVLKGSNLARVAGKLTPIPDMSGWRQTAPTPASGGSDSTPLSEETYAGDQDAKTGLYALDKVDIFNILCIPPDGRTNDPTFTSLEIPTDLVTGTALPYCQTRRAFLILDPPLSWQTDFESGSIGSIQLSAFGTIPVSGIYGAVYFPRLIKADPLMKGAPDTFSVTGTIAGLYAFTDGQRGVWKAPAGTNTPLGGVLKLEAKMNDADNGQLNPLGINALRTFPVTGSVIWGARTLMGADQLQSDYKYVNVRRLTSYIEASLYQGTQWAVFEPNDETLWSGLRLSVNSFMAGLSQQGAFYSYTVTCDKTTTSQTDIQQGIVNIVVTFAPVLPAEFVVITIQQTAGQSAS